MSRALGKIVYPFVPAHSRLRFRYWLASIDGSLESELRILPQFVSKTDVAVDIGANAGFYAFQMSKIFSKVYAFEINDELTEDLRKYNSGNITIMPVGLSSKAGEATLYIPVLNGLPLTGWASLAPGNCPDATGEIEKTVKIATLDSFHLENVSFIKVDVEGHEMHVLEGARQTLSTHRPTVLIEVKDQNKNAALQFFSGLNYTRRRLEDLTGIQGSPENYIFVPQ